ncbi:alpha-L-fucosidase [Dyadobacter subterraneus]|uniref:alpha-L-fucosidase n=1 Tax=Dyadobacter subterraneus TaxID=2773304 RepID=A0ABR9W5V2_9BACT|nr:alpha-L-fucosidase [Dyadobacter subterraneus]MBE9460803.1 alpha-L-fucosidase [Dyadobacter subterraneus]
MKKNLLLFFIIFAIGSKTQAQYEADWKSLDKRETPTWFKDAKFGIFIHWGLYSVPSWATKSGADGFGSGYSEWYWQRLMDPKLKIHKEFVAFQEKNYGPNSKYQDFAGEFKAELFNPDDWADIFKDAGAKYVVLTSKHHEGYALWPSAESWNWNSMDVGPHRDLAGDLTKSVKDKGLHMGFYYSLYEWYNPTYKSDVNRYVDSHMIPQMKDLVTRYQPDILWTDGEWDQTSETWKSKEFLTWLFNNKSVNKNIVVNDRWGNDTKGKHGSFFTTEYGQGTSSDTHPWEECRGIGESFGYNRNENLEDYMSSDKLIHSLIHIVSKGGNFLLNIGPTADGRIPVIMQQRLKDLGKWLKVNGDAIYGSERWNNSASASKDSTVFFTKKGKDLYVICSEWPDQLAISGISKPKRITMLGYTGNINSSQSKGKLIISAPTVTPKTLPCNSAWVFKLEGIL